jgi:hypothetical protein
LKLSLPINDIDCELKPSKVIELKFVQLPKASPVSPLTMSIPTSVTLLGITMFCKLVQPQKDSAPIETTPSGIDTCAKFVHSWKVKGSIEVMPVGILIDFKFELSWKQPAPIEPN